MARRKNPATARPVASSAPHAAPAAAQAPGIGPAPDSPAGAACAALAAYPGGATTAVIADAIRISRAATRAALTELETVGAVTRTKGGKPGTPDTWTLTAAGDTGRQPGDKNSPDGEPAVSSQTAGIPAAGGQHRGKHDAAGGTGQKEASDDQASSGPGAAAQAGVPDDSVDAPDAATAPEQGDARSAGQAEPSSGEPADLALVAEITQRIEQIQAAASAAAIVLPGNLRAALAGMDEIYDQAAQARRTLKTAVGGRRALAARPGGLREKVLGHLRDHPGACFTPHEIHKVLGHSSGAIANALDTLVSHGHAELAAEKPRSFRLAGNDAADSDGELAGAA